MKLASLVCKPFAASDFERDYLEKTHRYFLAFLCTHLLIMVGAASYYGTGIGLACGLSALILAGPVGAYLMAPGSRWTSTTFGVALIGMSGLLIHLGKGQIEMHFHIFVSLAILIVFGNPAVVLAAATAGAVHHLSFYFLLPASVFNYQASFGVVLLHATFVIVETIPAMLIAGTFGRFIEAQSEISRSLSAVAEGVALSAHEVSDSSGKLSESAQSQAEHLEQAACSLDEINGAVSRSADNTLAASEASRAAQQRVDDGKRAVAGMVNGMAKLNTVNSDLARQVEESFAQISQVVQLIGNIEEKTRVINDIVFQTKLLSFNASVEAARAGEHGKGFAVVAEEVGNLAAMSGRSASEIANMLAQSMEQVQRLLSENKEKVTRIVGESTQLVDQGKEQASDCGELFERISKDVANTAGLMNEISGANQKIRDDLSGITSAIQVVREVTRANTALASGTAGTSQQLDASSGELTRTLNRIMAVLNLAESASARAQARSPRAETGTHPQRRAA